MIMAQIGGNRLTRCLEAFLGYGPTQPVHQSPQFTLGMGEIGVVVGDQSLPGIGWLQEMAVMLQPQVGTQGR